MKKIIGIMTLFLFCGCQSQTIANPIVEYKTLDEAIQVVGYDFTVPSFIEGYDAKYSVIDDELIQVIYTNKNDSTIYIRKQKTSDDISGDYNEYGNEEDIDINSISVHLKSNSDGYHIATWQDNDYSYSIDSDSGLDFETIQNLIEQTK